MGCKQTNLVNFGGGGIHFISFYKQTNIHTYFKIFLQVFNWFFNENFEKKNEWMKINKESEKVYTKEE